MQLSMTVAEKRKKSTVAIIFLKFAQLGDNMFVIAWIICRHKLYHVNVEIIVLLWRVSRAVKLVFVTVKW